MVSIVKRKIKIFGIPIIVSHVSFILGLYIIIGFIGSDENYFISAITLILTYALISFFCLRWAKC